MKGVSLKAGQVVILSLDGSLVFVEAIEPTHAAVVALPEQPAERNESPVFTPGRVGAKKISPMAEADRVIELEALSSRNAAFLGTFEKLRAELGPNHVDRTPEEQTAWDAKMNPPDTRAAKAAAREAKKAGKKYLQKCATCGEQPGHPKHPADHEFVAPAAEAEPEEKPKREKKPKKERVGRPSKGPAVAGNYRWVGTDETLKLLRAVNGKYNDGNSGAVIIEAIKAAGEAGVAPEQVTITMAAHDRWQPPLERVTFAFQQLLAGGLIEAVPA